MPIWKREHFEGGEVWLEAPRPIRRTKRPNRWRTNCMRVTVRLFARLRDLAGTSELTREVPGFDDGPNALALAHSRDALTCRMRAHDVRGGECQCTRMTAVMHDGDEVAFMPPVSGG